MTHDLPKEDLVQVHDGHGHKYWVSKYALADETRMMLRTYTRNGKRREAEDGYAPPLHRANICPHPTRDFVTVTVPGESWKACQVCVVDVLKKIMEAANER